MKIFLMIPLLLMCLISFSGIGSAQDKPDTYKVVFQLTSEKPATWEAMVGNIENALNDLGPETNIEVVGHGNGIAFLKTANHKDLSKLEALHKKGVLFIACENTMRKKNIKKQDLLPFANTVSSGVGYLIKRQAEGWSYIRVVD